MSLIKYRVREVASDFGMAPKEIAEIISKYFEKPKSNTQVLTDEELNVVFDHITQTHQIDSLEQVFAVAPKAEAKPVPAPVQEEKPVQTAAKEEKTAAQAATAQAAAPAQEQKPKEPERKRERRVVDTSAVSVNSERFDDRVDVLISERAQNYSGGKQ